jgi:hypothetical protein
MMLLVLVRAVGKVYHDHTVILCYSKNDKLVDKGHHTLMKHSWLLDSEGSLDRPILCVHGDLCLSHGL